MLVREDPDFRQRFVADVETDRIGGRWEMSEDQGHTWRKDFDLIFERVTRATTRRKALEGVGRRIGTQYTAMCGHHYDHCIPQCSRRASPVANWAYPPR